MASYRDSRSQPSVAQTFFGNVFVPYISNFIWENYGKSYTSYANDRNTWRARIPFTDAIQKEIMLRTRLFLRCELDRYSELKNTKTNPEFLLALVNNIADYLSAYFMRNPVFQNRKAAKQYLKTALWDNFEPFQKLLHTQAAQRMARRERNARYSKPQNKSTEQASDLTKKAYAGFKKGKMKISVYIAGSENQRKK